MAQAHFFHASEMGWQSHPTIRGIHIKSLENKNTLETASVTLVEVDPGGVIEPHLHEQSSETAYVISGQAVLTLPEGEVTLSAGDGVTVPARTLHALRNTADHPVQILAVHIPPTL
jgi:mannose-6-phosphate isomerase-like protein (cupin superfamily)